MHAIRSTTAHTPGEAAKHAFGIHSTDTAIERMTFKEVPRDVMHADVRRTKAAVELLQAHEPLVTDKEFYKSTLDDLIRHWGLAWQRYETRYGPIDTGDTPYTVRRDKPVTK